MIRSIWTTYVGSVAALGVATCCVLPMTMMLLGLGGSWIAIFGKIAALSFYILGVSTAIVCFAWYLAYRQDALPRLGWWLIGSTAITLLAWIVVFNETRINDYLITLM